MILSFVCLGIMKSNMDLNILNEHTKMLESDASNKISLIKYNNAYDKYANIKNSIINNSSENNQIGFDDEDITKFAVDLYNLLSKDKIYSGDKTCKASKVVPFEWIALDKEHGKECEYHKRDNLLDNF